MSDMSISVRGLVDSDFELPLRAFSGILVGGSTYPATGYNGTRIELRFKDIDDVVAVSPYNLPIVTLNWGMSNKKKSRWGYFGKSLEEFLAPDQDILTDPKKPEIRGCEGLRIHWVFCDGQDGRPAPKPIWNRDADPEEFPDKMVPTPVWIVVELEGADTGDSKEENIVDYALRNLIGKTRTQFNKWAYADPRIRKDTTFQRSITDKSFINSLLKLNKVVEGAGGVFEESLPS